DLYESYCGSILASAALGVAAAGVHATATDKLAFVIVPMTIAGLGILLSILGCFLVRTKEDASQKTLLRALNRGVYGASFLILVLSLGVVWVFLRGPLGGDGAALRMWGAIAAGLVSGLVIGHSTEIYTSAHYKPTRGVADNALTGPATVIIDGFAVGLRSTGIPVIAVVAAILLAFGLAGGFGTGGNAVALGLFGVGIAAVGMLSTLGITLATDAYGPIADNAGGNAEMSHQPPEVRQRTDALDSLGNTTAATGKGFAIGSAALTALALLAAYVVEVQVGVQREADAWVASKGESAAAVEDLAGTMVVAREFGVGKFAGHERDAETRHAKSWVAVPGGTPARVRRLDGAVETVELKRVKEAGMADWMTFYNVTLMNPRVICGIMLGGMLTFLFSSMTMRAVGRAAVKMVNEVRRQFKEIPGIMEGTAEPDYASCVRISTAGAQREMIVPSLCAIIVPVATGLVLDVPGVLGLLAGALSSGFLLAISMSNAGGAWDNAKKYIEAGAHGGKGSDAHKAAVVGDTVGDPFKDTSGPSLNILIKLVSMVSVVMAGLTVKYGPFIGEWLAKLSQ
ncbi:MAG TPA: sodium/proton-translocating pyrophosphatase, partial [Planctomycetota bacterium]|nr:sodium/proton-translocating pyrophosphatase [Planctomycetota bacterium]